MGHGQQLSDLCWNSLLYIPLFYIISSLETCVCLHFKITINSLPVNILVGSSLCISQMTRPEQILEMWFLGKKVCVFFSRLTFCKAIIIHIPRGTAVYHMLQNSQFFISRYTGTGVKHQDNSSHSYFTHKF